MNDVQLKCFIKVADTLSFGKAAEELNMSQSSVSKQIHSLEDELNAKLLNRSTRMVELTALGERFLVDARNILHDMQRAKVQVSSFRNNASYSVRIGYTEVTELAHIANAIRFMRREYPNVYPTLRIGSLMDNLARLEQGTLDGVLGLNDLNYDRSVIVFKKLQDVRLVLAVVSGHPLYQRESVITSELKRFSQVLYLPDQHHRNDITKHLSKSEGDLYMTSSVAESYTLVSAGMGYAAIPSCYVSQDTSISAVPIVDSEKKEYGIFMHKGMVFPALRRFAQFYDQAVKKGRRV